MKRIYPLSGVFLVGGLLLSGCGGGGHDSCCSSNSKAIAKQRAVASMRITRATLAIAGFARRATSRAAAIPMGNRVKAWLGAIQHRRAATDPTSPTAPVLDTDLNLYYTLTVNADGSGVQNLFVDNAAQQPAGAFNWTAPQWTNGQPDNYPATFQTAYQITAGDFTGEHGTIALTVNDSTGDNGTMTIDLTDAQGEHCVSDFTIVNGVVKAKAHCTNPDNSAFDIDFETVGDVISSTVTYPDGGTVDVSVNPDGTATEVWSDDGGDADASGWMDSNGDDTIEYDDGSSETVDVDTGDDVDDSSNVESLRSSRRAKAHAVRVAYNARRHHK